MCHAEETVQMIKAYQLQSYPSNGLSRKREKKRIERWKLDATGFCIKKGLLHQAVRWGDRRQGSNQSPLE